MTTTATRPTATAKIQLPEVGKDKRSLATIAQSIGSKMAAAKHAEDVLRERKALLYLEVWLYLETYMLQKQETLLDACEVLAEKFPSDHKVAYWKNCHTYACTIRQLKLDPTKVNAAGLNMVSGKLKAITRKDHLKKVAMMLNDGAGFAEMSDWFVLNGYRNPVPGLNPASRKRLRKVMKNWSDWRPELDRWAATVALTSDGKHNISLSLTVDEEPICVGTHFGAGVANALAAEDDDYDE